MLNILLVEDNSTLRVIEVRYLLESLGSVDVHTAGTAEEAVTIAAAKNCDLVIMDCGLPDASDIEIAALLQPYCPSASFIVTSAHPPDLEKLREISPNVQVLPKPFEPDDLVSLVKGTVSASHPPPNLYLDARQDSSSSTAAVHQHELLNLLAGAMAEICAMEMDILAELEKPDEIRSILAQDIPSLKQKLKTTAERIKACLNSSQ